MSLLGAIRDNWRITMLVVMVVLSCFFLFVPGAPLGQSLGSDDPEPFAGENANGNGQQAAADEWTNLEFGIQLAGGARIEAPVIGMTAEDADVEGAEGIELEDRDADTRLETRIADELGVESVDVEVRLDYENREHTIEVFDDNVTEDEFRTTLNDVGVSDEDTSIRDGVTHETRSSMVDVLDDRMGEAGFEGGAVRQNERSGTIIVESPGHDLDDLREMIRDRGVVQVVAHYPTEDESGNVTYEEEIALQQEDLQNIGTVQYDDAREIYYVPVSVTEDRAGAYQEQMVETGIAQDDAQCYYPSEDEYGGHGYCQLIVLDDDVVTGLGMNPSLADSMRSGEWENSRQFRMTSGDKETAEEMRISLEAGSLQAQLDLDNSNPMYVSPMLADRFKSNALLTGVLAVLTVVLTVFLRYGDPRVAVPMSLTALSEVVILLGFAAAIQWPLDLATIAGFIAVVGTGVDDLIIIADEVMSEGGVSSQRVFDTRFSKAFWVIGAAAGTTIVAMSPLAVLDLGDLRGFAIVTILGVLIGVFITRPAYGNILRTLKTNR